MMRKIHILMLLALSGLSGYTIAQTDAGIDVRLDSGLNIKPALLQFSVENVTLPAKESMGMVGGTYFLKLSHELYVGPAAYGSITGKRGGFFTGGAELMWRKSLGESVAVQAGTYFGGGGGGSALVGGGMMIRPHVDLLWKSTGASYGISASQIRFPNGHINSNQIGLVASFDESFRYADLDAAGQSIQTNERGGVGFDRIMFAGGAYFPHAGATNLAGNALNRRIGYAGFRADRFLTDHLFFGLESGAFAHGGGDGYAEVLGALGVEYPVWGDRLKLGAVASLGLGGGGSLPVGGGLLAKAGVYGKVQLTDTMFVGTEVGLVDAPDGSFRGRFAILHLGLDLDAKPTDASQTKNVHGAEWALDLARYQNAQRYSGVAKKLDTIGLQINRDMGSNSYWTAQAHSAFDGEAGGFSIGLAGIGLTTPKFSNDLWGGVEFLLGAAGGGGVATKGGAVVQVMPYANFQLYNGLRVKLGYGRIRSIKGEFNAPVFNLALAVPFGLPGK